MNALTLNRPQTFNYKAQIIAQVIVEGDDNVKAFHILVIGLEKILFIISLICDGMLYFTEVIDFMLGDLSEKVNSTSTWVTDWGIDYSLGAVYWKVGLSECEEILKKKLYLLLR